MSKYFEHLVTVEEVKRWYRHLAQLHHPDRGGDLRVMQEVNAQYHDALKRLNGTTSRRDDGSEHKYQYDFDVESAVVDKIAAYLGLNLPDVDCALIGTWLWVTGETRPWKEQLKALGFRWHPTRGCWFWHQGKWRGRQSRAGLDGLAMRYGYRAVKGTKSSKFESLD
jgi:hypothetical protein